MKRALLTFILIGTLSTTQAQGLFYGLFGKEKIQNRQNMDERTWSYGYYLGFNSYDFKFDYKTNWKAPTEVLVNNSMGFNVGVIGNLRLNNYMDLRLEPGVVFTTRNLVFPQLKETREVKSTYIHVPLLLKFSTKRLNNFKPFIVGGLSFSYNLSSNESSIEDNYQGQFRMKDMTYYYEVGIGIDLYLYYFKFTPSIRAVFAINDELVRDTNPNSVYTGNIGQMRTRGIFLNFTFQ